MGSVVTFLLTLAPDLVALFQELWSTSGGDIRKAQDMISGSRKHYRKQYSGLSARLDVLEGKVPGDD